MLHSSFGLLALIALALLVSEAPRQVHWRTIWTGTGLQLLIALLMFKTPGAKHLLLLLNNLVTFLEEATQAGTAFVFGYLGGAPLPFTEMYSGRAFILAFEALPIILVISAISSVLFYWRIIPLAVNAFAVLLRRTMRLGGAPGVAVAANIFVGMVEAPLLIKPYLARMTRSELFVLMTAGMATIAGTVLVLYAAILRETIPDALAHILAASLISAPAAIMTARIMVPESDRPGEDRVEIRSSAASTMDAVVRGTADGLHLLLNVVAMLLVLVALVSLANISLGIIPNVAGAPLTLQRILGWVMCPVVWLIGIPWSEARVAGALMGTKTILNELLAYLEMTNLPPEALSQRSRMIMTYAMCGFANLGSLGIMVGGLKTMCPERHEDIVALGPKSILSGTLATLMTGAVAGILL